jgi:hypothetical protein
MKKVINRTFELHVLIDSIISKFILQLESRKHFKLGHF